MAAARADGVVLGERWERQRRGRSRVVAGADELPREQVFEFQRARLLAATVDVLAEHGAGGLTVSLIAGRSGVSRRTFYEIFEDCEDCLAATFQDALRRISEIVTPAFSGRGPWRRRTRDALIALLAFLDSEPNIARLLFVESLAAGPEALEDRARALEPVIAAIDQGRSQTKTPAGQSSLTAECVVGAVHAVIHARILENDKDTSLLELANDLMSTIVLPYFGLAAAREELGQPLPSIPSREQADPRRSTADALRRAHMRLTYRTICVLLAIAAIPNSSNRQIAGHAGVTDQGQISKLLARLERVGLVENTSDGWSRGEPNAWRLTATGQQVTQTIRAHAGNEHREVA